MRRYLVDTCVILWALNDSSRLSKAARAALLSGELVVSVLSYWEIVQLVNKGRITIANPSAWWQRSVDGLGAKVISIRANHATALHGLPDHHRDPFDRMLVAQAIVEDLTIMTSDLEIPKYPVRVLW